MKLFIILLIVLLLYLFPSNEKYNLNDKKVINENKYHEIYLIDKNNMISKTNVIVNNINKKELALELIETLIIDGKYTDKLPNGFNAILPELTKINNIIINNNEIEIDFNDKIFSDIRFNDNTILEAIIYTLTSIKGINKVKVLIDGELLKKLPNNELINNPLDRSYGINKEYDIFDIKNISKVTIYYNSKFNNKTYFVPVTKYLNTNKNKIEIIIEELQARTSLNTNLISYLNDKTELLNYSFNDEILDLNFNNYLFDNKEENKVLEEVIYSIYYSLKDTLNINRVNFYVNNKKIYSI